ncbi:hypothetical protein ABZ519_17335 [Streptomyces collinus]
MLFGAVQPDNGEVNVMAPGGRGHLAQTLDLPDSACVGDAVDLALAEVRALEQRMQAAGAALDGADPAAYDRYAAIEAEFEARGGCDADRRVDVALRHLGEPTDRLARSAAAGRADEPSIALIGGRASDGPRGVRGHAHHRHARPATTVIPARARSRARPGPVTAPTASAPRGYRRLLSVASVKKGLGPVGPTV